MTGPQDPAQPGGEVFIAPAGTPMPEPDDIDWTVEWVQVGYTTEDGLTWIDVDRNKPRT